MRLLRSVMSITPGSVTPISHVAGMVAAMVAAPCHLVSVHLYHRPGAARRPPAAEPPSGDCLQTRWRKSCYQAGPLGKVAAVPPEAQALGGLGASQGAGSCWPPKAQALGGLSVQVAAVALCRLCGRGFWSDYFFVCHFVVVNQPARPLDVASGFGGSCVRSELPPKICQTGLTLLSHPLVSAKGQEHSQQASGATGEKAVGAP